MAMNLKEDEGEIIGLTVKEISHVIAPAVDGVLKGQQLDACYLIVKENDPEDDGDDADIDVLLKKDAMSTESAAPLRENAEQGMCKGCNKPMKGDGEVCKCTHKEDIQKEPVTQNTHMVTPTVSDETKMELQRTLKELVENCGGLDARGKLMLAKVCAYHGVDVPDVGEVEEVDIPTVDDEIERALSVMERLGKIVANVQPKTPATPPKPVAPVPGNNVAEKESVPTETENAPLADEILVETTKEVPPTEEPLLTRVARILEKQREQNELDEYMSVLKEAAKKIQGVHDEYADTKRSLLKAMGKDPDGDQDS